MKTVKEQRNKDALFNYYQKLSGISQYLLLFLLRALLYLWILSQLQDQMVIDFKK